MAPPTKFMSDEPKILILHDNISNISMFGQKNITNVVFDQVNSNSNTSSTSLWPSSTPPFLMLNETDNSMGAEINFDQFCYASPEDYDLIPSVLCSSLFVLGIVFCTFGARCCRAFAFFLATIFTGIISYFLLTNLTINFRPLPADIFTPEVGALLFACLVGLVFGTIASLVNLLSAIMIGVYFGALLGVTILSVIFIARPWVSELQGTIPPGMGAIFGAILSLVGAVATINMPKGCTIVTSSSFGAALSMLCVDYFVEKFAILSWYRDHLNIDSGWSSIFGQFLTNPLIESDLSSTPLFCPGSQILLIAWALFTLIGIIIQSCCTCRGVKPLRKERSYEHVATTPSTMLLTPGSADITSTSRDKGKSVEDLRLEQKHRKYRYLYQVRTAHGDVLSQQYFQNIQNQKKLAFPPDHTDTCTFNSDVSSHFLPESRTTTLSVA